MGRRYPCGRACNRCLNPPSAGFREVLSALGLALLKLERRLYRYAHTGPELLEMADEGLGLAARARAKLRQVLSSAQHTQGHLQVMGWASGAPSPPAPPATTIRV